MALSRCPLEICHLHRCGTTLRAGRAVVIRHRQLTTASPPEPAGRPYSFSKGLPQIVERAAGLGWEAKAAAQQAAKAETSGQEQPSSARQPGTGRFQNLPLVSPPGEHLNSAVKRTTNFRLEKGAKWQNSKLRDARTLAKTMAAMKLDKMTKELAGPMKSYVKGFPQPDRLHPFEKALLDLTLGVDHYTKVLARVDSTRKSILEVGKQYAAQASKANNKKEAAAVEEEGLKRLESLYQKGSSSVERLMMLAKELRRLPVVETETPTVALVGAPNVGKSSLVKALSSGQPEVCDYPFTTRTIKMGHFYVDGRRHQVTDTPGLLQREDEGRNAMEMLTIASLAHLPTSVIFVADLTEGCGTTVENQWKIRCELKERFPDKPWVDVFSKADLLEDVFSEVDCRPPMDSSIEVTFAEDMAWALRDNALRVSSLTGDGLEDLQGGVLSVVHQAYSTGMVPLLWGPQDEDPANQ